MQENSREEEESDLIGEFQGSSDGLRPLLFKPRKPPQVEEKPPDEISFETWYRGYLYKDIDSDVAPFLKTASLRRQWLRGARTALFFSGNLIAERLGISRSAYYEMEKNEAVGAITVKTLERAARAMGCEFVYAVRPRERVSFSNVLWKKLFPKARQIEARLENTLWAKSIPSKELETYRARRRGVRAKFLVEQSRFRKQQGWSRRRKRRS